MNEPCQNSLITPVLSVESKQKRKLPLPEGTGGSAAGQRVKRRSYQQKKTESVVCDHCGTKFLAGKYQVKHGRRFCTSRCSSNHQERKPVVDRFLESITKTESCWMWNLAVSHKGYGRAYYQQRYLDAHRLAYLLFVGPIPNGLWILHKCDNRRCVNPDHLFLGTAMDNTHDALAKKRLGFGENGSQAKLKFIQVQEICELIKAKVERRIIAAKYGVTPACIGSIANKYNWNTYGQLDALGL